jgi:hypothetical protein
MIEKEEIEIIKLLKEIKALLIGIFLFIAVIFLII